MAPPIIKTTRLSKHYRAGRLRQQVLHDVDLAIEEGEFVAIVGTSGSGKSTLLNVVGALDRNFTGDVVVAGTALATQSDRQLSRFRHRAIGFVFQQFNLLEHLSVHENVALPALFGPSVGDARERANAALTRVGLGDRAGDLAAMLSGGQKQRVAIARALFNRPTILLCDEPTGNLDSRTGAQIIDLFGELNRQQRITLVIVTHEPRVAEAADRVISLEDGRIRDGEATDATRSPISMGAP